MNNKTPDHLHDCCGGKAEQKPEPSPPQADRSCCHGGDHVSPPVQPPAVAKYFCPMCPGVESDKPGACPKCGMVLELNPAYRASQRTIYTCPMHPQIEQDHPGVCPICGMALEPKAGGEAPELENTELKLMAALLDRSGSHSSRLNSFHG